MKIAIIGGGGKISSAMIYELLNDIQDLSLTFALFGTNAEKIQDTLQLSERFRHPNAKIFACNTIEETLQEAEIVFYCATYGTKDYAGIRSMGVTNGAYLLYIGEKVSQYCPNAWFLTVTNPPCVPLMAVRMRYGLQKLIGLCNAPIFVKKVIASFLNCEESRLHMYEFGVNHEFWYYDIRLDDRDIYDELRQRLPQEYDRNKLQGEFHQDFPEWGYGFPNTIALMRLTGYLSGPVGCSNRYKNMPVTDMWSIASRPTAEDFKKLLDPKLSNYEVLKGTRRCAAGIPLYCADVLKSLLYSDGREHPILAFNNGAISAYKNDSMLQMTCAVFHDKIVPPHLEDTVPAYIHAVMASRIYQNHLMAEALAEQSDLKLRQALSIYPERIDVCETESFLASHSSVEPFIQLD